MLTGREVPKICGWPKAYVGQIPHCSWKSQCCRGNFIFEYIKSSYLYKFKLQLPVTLQYGEELLLDSN